MKVTADWYAGVVQRKGDGLRLVAHVPGRFGSGFVLTAHQRHPDTLGVAAISSLGESGHLAVDRETATGLRDALTAWLGEESPRG